MAIEKSYMKVMQQREKIDRDMKDEMDVRKVIYVRERQNILNDYDRGLTLLKEKYEKQKASTLRLGRMRGGLAIERSKQEALRLKMQFMVKHRKMSERRARVVKTIKAEYFEDFREKQYENRARNARAKSSTSRTKCKEGTPFFSPQFMLASTYVREKPGPPWTAAALLLCSTLLR